MEKQGKVVTVSRQMGSGGTHIGYEVAKALGFTYIDREILRRAATLLNRDEVSVEEYEEKSCGRFEKFLRSFAIGAPEISYVPKDMPIYEKDLFLLEGKIIKELVKENDAVVMGRGGFYLLKDRPATIHLFIHAPHDYRLERIVKDGIAADLRQAQTRIDESDRRRTRFIKDMTGVEWTNARNYHLCVDSSAAGPSESIRLIADFVKTALG